MLLLVLICTQTDLGDALCKDLHSSADLMQGKAWYAILNDEALRCFVEPHLNGQLENAGEYI